MRTWKMRTWKLLMLLLGFLMLFPRATTAQGPDAQSRYLPTGPPPARGYEPYLGAVRARGTAVIGGVPGYLWRHGCGPTAAGMVIGYWDGNGFDDLIPGDSSTQTAAVNQAIASGDGANTHYSDYSLPIDEYGITGLLADKSETGGAHTSHCLADFMETSWSSRGNYYGWSWLSDVDDALFAYVEYANTTYGSSYQATSWNETWGDFSWGKFKDEIDAGRPMIFLVDTDGDGYTDHFVTAIGYRDTNGYEEYACLDTWNPEATIRWERFRGVGTGVGWGIYGITYFRVAIPIPDVPLANATPRTDSMTATSAGEVWRYYYVDLPGGNTDLVIDLYDLSADIDLYVRYGSKPTTSSYQCRPYVSGTLSEQCSFATPGPGRWWIGLNNWDTGTISYTVRAAWDGAIFCDGFELGIPSRWSSQVGQIEKVRDARLPR